MTHMTHPLSKITAVAGEGGGGKGLAYVQALRRLEKYLPDGLRSLTRVVGTSAFAITAGALALGADGRYLDRLARETPWQRFLDRGRGGWTACGLRLIRRHGLFRPDFARGWLATTMRRLGSHENVTFGRLWETTGRDLRVVTTNETTRRMAVWSYLTTPDALVIDGVLASMLVPLAYPPLVVDGSLHCDGGVVENHAMSQLDDLPLDQCLGLRVEGDDELTTTWPPPRTVLGRIGGLWATLYRDGNNEQIPERYKDSILRIPTGNLKALRFGDAVRRLPELYASADRAFDAFERRLRESAEV